MYTQLTTSIRPIAFMLIGIGLLAFAALSTQPAVVGAPLGQTVPIGDTIPIEPGYQIHVTDAGTLLQWHVPTDDGIPDRGLHALAALEKLSTIRFAGYDLPMQLQTLLLPEEISSTVLIHSVNEMLWPYTITPAEPFVPPVIDDEEIYAPRQDQALNLPPAPVFLLREGRMRGQRVGVLALSPLYRDEHDEIKVALTVSAMISGAVPINDLTELFLKSTPMAPDESDAANDIATRNPTVGGHGIKILVDAAGIQQVRGAALIDAGFSIGSDLYGIHLRHKEHDLPLDVRDDDGRLDAETRFLFYAAPSAHSMEVGDRWNMQAVYILSFDGWIGPRMKIRSVLPAAAPMRTTAFQEGIWADYKYYESNMPGVDGDYWYSEKMVVDPSLIGNPTGYAPRTASIDNTLPAALGSGEEASYMLTGSARSIAEHSLQVYVSSQTETATWLNEAFYENWQHTLTSTVYPRQIDLVLQPTDGPSDIRFDKLYWRIPVRLNFDNNGGGFSGVEGLWRYQLTRTPAVRTLYDVTAPLAPVILQIPSGTDFSFEDGPVAHKYILADETRLHTPTIVPRGPFVLAQLNGADTVYIAPAEFHAALAPLVAHRQGQGYQVALVDLQDIYDQWAYGYVAPEAIRSFLQFATKHWQPAPIAAVLVGDSTVDPHNYLGMGNPNILPAYLAHVDKWIGETACENCFAQLDGDDPLDTKADPNFLIDIWIGRFSVQNEEQLTAVVDKILRYETANDIGFDDTWRQSSLYIADNYIQPNGAEDSAGDFAYLSDVVFEGDPYLRIPPSQSANMFVERVYYDPRPGGVSEPWREPNAAQARRRTIDAFNRGYGLVSYNGHSNHYQLASTDRTIEEPYMFGTNDIFKLDNGDRLPIILQMTCYTSQFTVISNSGTTIDERFQRHENAGGVAIWGSAGLTVAYGHDALMRGFQNQLWRSPPLQARLGELTNSGYLELFSQGACCQESRKVFLLLGDPLTPARVWAADRAYFPNIQK